MPFRPQAMISTRKKNYIVEYLPTTIRAARLSSRVSPLSVEAILEVERGEDESANKEIRRFAGVKSNGFLNGKCSVYPANRIIRKLRVDSPKGREADFVLDFIRREENVNPNDLKAYCLSAGNGCDRELEECNKQDILVCGALKTEIEEIQKDLLGNGIFPQTLEIGSVGIIGVIMDMMTWANLTEPLMFLEIERDFTTAIILGPSGVEVTRRIEFGSSNIATALKEEMNLKDEAAAAKLLSSKDFDFGSMAHNLLRKLLRELQSTIGFFEVQTGQTVSSVFCLRREGRLDWLENSVCHLLNVDRFDLDVGDWMESKGISFGSKASISNLDLSWLGFLALMCDFDCVKEEG